MKTAILLAILTLSPTLFAQSTPCRWYQLRCSDQNDTNIEGLPPEAPRSGTIITIDVKKNTAYLFRDGQLVRKSKAATGSEKTLVKGDDEWVFHTPRGHLKVLRKIDDPVWRKPDWAFIEAGERVPPPDSPKRMVKGHLGKYALDLGDGILIHGTDDIDSIGRSVSHGCIRLPDEMLETVYGAARVGTDVFIFDSEQ
ncbi:MAG TPA: L,D-transpeptidase [Thermoanaerobaculia bacterium]|nr:L,D-transpeptidase [Thermoanaerobaculia bacterium]